MTQPTWVCKADIPLVKQKAFLKETFDLKLTCHCCKGSYIKYECNLGVRGFGNLQSVNCSDILLGPKVVVGGESQKSPKKCVHTKVWPGI